MASQVKVDILLKKNLSGLKINEPLKKWTTFRIGGPARYFFMAKNENDLIKAISLARKLKIPYFILGGGSNILVSDKGFEGMVIKISTFAKASVDKQNSKIIAGAGVRLSSLVNFFVQHGLTGFEWAVGIPGTLGGAIWGNAGAYGKSIANLVEEIKVLEVLERKNQKSKIKNQKYKPKIKKFLNKDCRFGYRDSIFKHYKDLIVLSAILRLKKGNRNKIKREIFKILKKRKEKIPSGFSAGCVFRNYQLPTTNYQLFDKYPQLQNFRKTGTIPAGWLIEKSGLKGKKIGEAKISEKHANFIINQGRAKAKDVLKLMQIIKEKVKNKFGLRLEEEIEYLGLRP